MLPDVKTPCFGLWELFDSIDIRDHRAAKELCDECPVLLACARQLGDMKRMSGVYGHPEGTWAGRLELPRSWRQARPESAAERRLRIAQEEASFSPAEARQANSAYRSGDRTEWAKTGARVHQRRRRRVSRAQGDVA